MASVFCDHRRVRTVCPECKPRPAPAQPEAPTGRAPGPAPERAPPAAAATPRGPGKPLMPTRRRPRKATREEAENAEAWWVRRD